MSSERLVVWIQFYFSSLHSFIGVSLVIRSHTKLIQTINHLWQGWIYPLWLHAAYLYAKRFADDLSKCWIYLIYFGGPLHQSGQVYGVSNRMVQCNCICDMNWICYEHWTIWNRMVSLFYCGFWADNLRSCHFSARPETRYIIIQLRSKHTCDAIWFFERTHHAYHLRSPEERRSCCWLRYYCDFTSIYDSIHRRCIHILQYCWRCNLCVHLNRPNFTWDFGLELGSCNCALREMKLSNAPNRKYVIFPVDTHLFLAVVLWFEEFLIFFGKNARRLTSIGAVIAAEEAWTVQESEHK